MISELSQSEADALINLEKKRIDTKIYNFPSPGETTRIPVVSLDGSTEFLIKVYHSIIKRQKVQTAELYEKSTPLVRMCVGGKPHTNPSEPAPLTMFSGLEGEDLGENHLHYYAENWGTVWGIPVNISQKLLYPLTGVVYHFMDVCNVVDKPALGGGL